MTVENQNQGNPPTPGSEEYNQQMADKFRQAKSGPETDVENVGDTAPQMPEGGFDKYYNQETGAYNWEAHARELMYNQTRQSKSKDEGGDPESQDGNLKLSEESGEQQQQVGSIVERAGLDMQALGQQIIESGDISDDAKAALENQGIPREMIDDYIEGIRVKAQAQKASALDYAGGEDQWKQIDAWSQANLSAEDRATYNEQLKGPNWKMALDSLKARYAASSKTAREGNLNTGGNAGNGAPPGYTSRAQMKADMANPQYRTDPSFRAQVAQKMKHATWADD